MWDLPRPGLEPVSPALAGRFSTTAPPGKPRNAALIYRWGPLIYVDSYWSIFWCPDQSPQGGSTLCNLVAKTKFVPIWKCSHHILQITRSPQTCYLWAITYLWGATKFKDEEGRVGPGIKAWFCHLLVYDVNQVIITYLSINTYLTELIIIYIIVLMSTFPSYTLKSIKTGTISNIFIALSSFNK